MGEIMNLTLAALGEGRGRVWSHPNKRAECNKYDTPVVTYSGTMILGCPAHSGLTNTMLMYAIR